jgi:hypothetical protein
VQKVSEAWQEQLKQNQHGRTAGWVEDVHTRGEQNLWSSPVPMVDGTTVPTSEGEPPNEETNERETNDRNTETEAATTETPVLGPASNERQLVPYCELRYLTRPHLKQPNPLQDSEDPVSTFRKLGMQGVSSWPLDPKVIDHLAEEIPKRQRWERTGKKDVNVEVVVPKITDGADNNTENDIIAEQEEDEESKRIFSQVLARNTSKIKVPRLRRKRKLEAQRQAEMIRDIPRLASSVGSATYHVPSSLSASEKDDALRYIIPDVSASDTHSVLSIFGVLEDLGKIYRILEEKKEKRPSAQTEMQQRRREKFYAKERILPRRAQKNHDPGKYKSKVLRTEQDLGNGILKSFLDFDLGWTMLEYTNDAGEKRLMIFSSLQVVVEEAS